MRGFSGQFQRGGMQKAGIQQGMRSDEQSLSMQQGRHGGSESSVKEDGERGGPGGHKGGRPALEDLTQTVENTDDGSIVISLSGTDPEGEVRSKTLTLSETEGGAVEIQSLNEEGYGKTVTVSEDTEDGGVDLDIVMTREDGETVTRHIELDMTEDGTLSFSALTTVGDETFTKEHEMDLARFLGEEGEVLSVLEVVEAHLERGPIDMSMVDLSALGVVADEIVVDETVVDETPVDETPVDEVPIEALIEVPTVPVTEDLLLV